MEKLKVTVRTKNFNPEVDKKMLCTCGNEDCTKVSVNQFTADKLQLIREDFGKPMNLTSGGRCKLHKNERAKEKPGDHALGYAVDIACNNTQDETKLKVLAGRHGATRVAGGAYCGFVHLAWTPTERKDVPTWSY